MKYLILVFLLALSRSAFSQESTFADIHIEKKSGQQAGPAVVSISGKGRRILPRALQVWPIMNDHNALILAVPHSPHKTTIQCELVYTHGESRKHRTLGAVPFIAAELKQIKSADGTWAFLLTGSAGGHQTLIAADLDGVHGRLEDISSVHISDENVKYRDIGGNYHTVSVPMLLVAGLTDIYQTQSSGANGIKAVQFLRNGKSVLVGSEGHVDTDTWWTDGERIAALLADNRKVRTHILEE